MIIDFSYLQSPVVESFVVALLHSLWQGVLISFVLSATLRVLPAPRTSNLTLSAQAQNSRPLDVNSFCVMNSLQVPNHNFSGCAAGGCELSIW